MGCAADDGEVLRRRRPVGGGRGTTRYLYDLSQNGRDGTPTFDGQAVSAHGNLYKTEELLPAGGPVVTWTNSTGATAAYAYVNRAWGAGQ
ncbi:MAG: hypothetical protein ACYDHD_06605 [Vulcanimicrobiaceae bacterium]